MTKSGDADSWRRSIIANWRENWPIYIGQFLLAILIGSRDLSIGTDTERYAAWYQVIADCHCFYGNIEPGFNIFGLISALLTNNAGFYFFSISLTLFVMLNVVSGKIVKLDSQIDRDNKKLLFALILLAFFFSPFFVSAHINAIRQGMAAFMLFYAFLSFQEKSWGKSILASVLAVSFHLSSIMYLALFPLLMLPIWILLVILAGLSVIYASGLSEFIVSSISGLFNLPLHDYVTQYRADVAYQSGVRYDFLIFSMLGVGFGLLGRYFSNKKAIIDALLKIYIVLLIPFLMLGYANFSNRYVYTAWLFLSILTAYAAYSIPVWGKLQRIITPYTVIIGQSIFLLMALNGIAR
jgi:hypothetical protein